MSRAVPLPPDAERLSRLAGLLKATLPLNPLATRPAGIFVTHILNDRVERHFERLRRESAPHVDWRLFHNTFSLADVAAGRSFIPRRVVDMRLRQAVGHGHFLAGFMDTLLIPLALLARRRHVWVMEYDVDFSGNWAPFFAQFAGLDADLLTTTLNTPDRDPNWAFWPGAVSPPGAQGVRTRAFMPVFRASRRFLDLYRRQIATGQWAGHYEFLLPTIARAGGLKVADLGGNGPFVASGLAGRNYRNTPNDPDLGRGSFIFRPARNAYFAEAPEQFDLPNLLYHPIKVSA